jgi:two-component system KDP operon response regulator KdpE
MSVTRILVIEDSPEIIEAISLAFQIRWPEAKVSAAKFGMVGADMAIADPGDVVILDLGLPDVSGFEVLKRIRSFSDVPLLILTARADEDSIVKGLEMGADDYMTKPFKSMELLARVQALTRRAKGHKEDVLRVDGLVYNPVSFQLYLDDKEISITRTEGLILGHLMRNAGVVVSHTGLAEAIWGDDYPEAEDSIKVHIRRLRQKIEADPSKPSHIQTKVGIGYIMPKAP